MVTECDSPSEGTDKPVSSVALVSHVCLWQRGSRWQEADCDPLRPEGTLGRIWWEMVAHWVGGEPGRGGERARTQGLSAPGQAMLLLQPPGPLASPLALGWCPGEAAPGEHQIGCAYVFLLPLGGAGLGRSGRNHPLAVSRAGRCLVDTADCPLH